MDLQFSSECIEQTEGRFHQYTKMPAGFSWLTLCDKGLKCSSKGENIDSGVLPMMIIMMRCKCKCVCG